MRSSSANWRRVSQTTRLARRLIAYRRSAAALLFAAGLLLSIAVVGVALTSRSADVAVRTAVKADLGGWSYAMTARTEEGTQLLDKDNRFVPVAEVEGAVSAGDAQLPAAVRITPSAQPLALGVIVSGEHPDETSETALSRKIARDLDVSVGDYVRVRGGPERGELRVVGIVADPSNATAATAALVDDDPDMDDVVTWVSQVDPYTVPKLQSLLDARVLTYQSRASMEQARVEQLPSTVGLLRHLPLPLGAVLAVLVGTIMLSLRRIASRDQAALQAAGVSARRAYRTLAGTALVLVFAGEIIGAVAAVIVIWLCRSLISQRIGQDWVTVSFPWLTAGIVIAAVPFIGALARPAARAGARIASSYRNVAHRMIGPGPGVALALLGLAVLGVVAAARTQSPPGQLVRIAPIGAMALAAAIAVLARLIVTSRLPPGMKALVRVLTGHVAVVAVVGGVIAVSGGAYAATATRDANGFSTLTRAPQPAGSLLMTEVPTTAARAIVATYRELGGTDSRRYTLTDESRTQVRVTGTRLVQCMESANIQDPNRAPNDCFPQQTMSPIAIVALSAAPSSAELNSADPGLVSGDGVGLLTFDVGSPVSRRVAVTDAVPDQALGGNMPGLVIPADGKVAKAFGLRPGKTELVALLGFNKLSGSQQALLRSTIARVAPAAQVTDATERQGYELDKSLASSVAIAGAALVALVTLGGTAAVLTGHRKTRRILADVGAGRRHLRRLAVLWAATLIATYTSSIALAWLAARLAGINIAASYGWTWLLPGTVGLLVTIAFVISCTRIPARTGE